MVITHEQNSLAQFKGQALVMIKVYKLNRSAQVGLANRVLEISDGSLSCHLVYKMDIKS